MTPPHPRRGHRGPFSSTGWAASRPFDGSCGVKIDGRVDLDASTLRVAPIVATAFLAQIAGPA
jgi:hypothetical protein